MSTATRKSPAFSFYPDSWFGGTMLLTPEQRAAYMDLLCAQWLNGPLSKQQARVVCRGVSEENIDVVLSQKFVYTKGLYANARLEEERQKQQAKRDSGSKGGSKRQANAKQTASELPSKPTSESLHSVSVSVSVSDSGSVSDSQEHSASAECCSEPASRTSEPPSEATVETATDLRYPVFPAIAGKSSKERAWRFTDDLCIRLAEAFPAVDVRAEARKAHAWLMANPARRKTASGMEDFLRRWFAKEQNRADRSGKVRTFAEQRLENTSRAIEDFVNG